MLRLFVNMLEIEAVAAEIDVDEPPNELTFIPFMLEIKVTGDDKKLVNMLEIDAVALEIDVVERKARVVAPPNELISTPFIELMKTAPVDKLFVEIDSDVNKPELLMVVAFIVAAVVVPVIDKEPTPAAPDTVSAPITADVAAKLPVTVLFSVNNDPPEIDPVITAVAPFTAPVAFRVLSPTFPENEPDVPEIAPSEVRLPT